MNGAQFQPISEKTILPARATQRLVNSVVVWSDCDANELAKLRNLEEQFCKLIPVVY